MANYFRSLALLLVAAPALATTSFIAPRVAAVPGGVVTFRLPGAPSWESDFPSNPATTS